MQRGLAARGINTSVSRIGSSRFDFEARGLTEVVRASVHVYNTDEELQRCVEAVRQLAAGGAAQREDAADDAQPSAAQKV